MVKLLNKVYFFPLVYFFDTRYSKSGPLYTYVTLNIGFCFLAIVISHGEPRASAGAILNYLAAWSAFAVVYELGYLMNDAWSAKRERARGIKRAGVQKPVLTLMVWEWLLFLGIRVMLLGCIGIFLAKEVTFQQGLWITGVIAVTAITFMIHNILFPPWRFLTFITLYALRYVLCVPFLGTRLDAMLFGLLAAPIVLMHTLGYFQFKVSANRDYYARNGILLSDVTICVILTYCAYEVALRFAHAHHEVAVGWFIVYLFVVDVFFRTVSLFKALKGIEGRNDVKYHAHTLYSHDGKMSLADLRREMDARGWYCLYMAEHEEDFNPQLYGMYTAECNKVSSTQAMLVPGLEYIIDNQHILALGLKSYLPIRHDFPADIMKLYSVAERVVWAHPSIGLRRLYDLAYVWQTFRIGMLCEAVEWGNRKSVTMGRNILRSKFICILLCWLRPGRKLIYAEDAHSCEDLETIASIKGHI